MIGVLRRRSSMIAASKDMGSFEQPVIEPGEVFELIDQTAKNLRRIQRLTVRDSGLTPPQYQVLKSLWDKGDLPLKDLAQACNCTRATITGLVDTLEAKELVQRQPNPVDRRSLLATLTPEGQALQDQTAALEKVYASCCQGLSTQEFRHLSILLGKLNESLQS
jgi:DNA-binding MarR family transcriptional regulator